MVTENTKAQDLLTTAKKVIGETIESVSADLRKISLDLHENPEIGMQEYHAHQVLTDYLERQGFKVTRSAAGLETAFIAEYSRGEGRRIGFCSEYDALPEIGHACGHNCIAIAGLACAIAVKKLLEEGHTTGKVVLFGTPSEEPLDGKIMMCQKRVFQDNVDACMMLHPGNRDGNHYSGLAQHDFTVEYHGKPAHAGGAPWMGVNALDAICQAWVNVGLLRQQLEESDRVHGIITNGGQAANVVPDFTSGKFYIRAPSAARIEQLKVKVENCFKAAALSTGCEMKLKWRETGMCKEITQNEFLADAYAEYYKELGGAEMPPRFIQKSKVMGGSTDFGNVSACVPGIHPGYSIHCKSFPHTREFAEQTGTMVAHEATLLASKALATVGARVLIEKEFYESVYKSWDATVPPQFR
ncbi:hypothetical protein LRAMOSA04510 [Lichtheimia ramosa]|uniref:Peptidase M20 domain-containing protein 2 n=1 Tax=Lichtheimia ramosa TaxID=688394 RepID=A0A077WYG5_9FUNG|nr:hypothetical protein LRAMOSA04510 [Lichtheimia ramosa]